MIRYAFALTLALGAIAGVAAAVEASAAKSLQQNEIAARTTVIEKNSPFPVLGPLVFDDCAVEDCSELSS
jgi:hypothetical protein